MLERQKKRLALATPSISRTLDFIEVLDCGDNGKKGLDRR